MQGRAFLIKKGDYFLGVIYGGFTNLSHNHPSQLHNFNGMKTNLFLDDIRHPYDAFKHTQETMFLQWEWVVVKNFAEFTNWIRRNGVPDFVSFDHDLHDLHYTPPKYWNDLEVSKAFQQERGYGDEPTGKECAVWLVSHCHSVGKPLPKWYCHSQNPIGRERIEGVLRNLTKGVENESNL